MPITMMKIGEACTIKRVGGKEEIRRFLGSLGFVEGAAAKVISENGGNVIVNIRDSRVAVSKEMANKIHV